MYNLDDQNLDRLSSDAAENYKPPVSTPSWDAMQRRLDYELPEEKKKRRGILWFFIAAGLLAGGGFYWYSQQKDDTATKPRIADTYESKPVSDREKKQQSANNEKPVASDNSKNATAKPSTEKAKDNLPVTVTTKPAETKDEKRLAQTADKTQPASAYQPEKAVTKTPVQRVKKQPAFVGVNGLARQDIAVIQKKNKAAKNKQSLADNKPLLNNSDAGDKVPGTANDKKIATGNDVKTEKDNTEAATTTETTVPTTDQKAATTADTPVVIVAQPADSIATAEKDNTAKKDEKKKPSVKNDKAFSIALLAGADLSTVKFKYGENTGYNIGLIGGYHFNKNWSVHTGLIYTKKIYKLGGKDYNPPKPYFTYYVDLQSVQGYCQMFEVPVIGRYTFNSRSSGKFFASTGLSSYFMQEEDYTYNYKRNGVQMSTPWSNTDNHTYWFSILHLSAGFEKPLGKRLLWQVEPYAKLPLAGVGFGNIKLSSFGVNFSLQFRQPVKK
jgi:hypothetical protein